MDKRKRTNNDPHSIKEKIKNRAARIPLKTGGDFMCSRRVSSSCSLVHFSIHNVRSILSKYQEKLG
jgi:hypothetical protein